MNSQLIEYLSSLEIKTHSGFLQLFEKLDTQEIEKIIDSLNEAHHAIRNAIFYGTKDDLYPEEIVEIKRSIAETIQIFEDFKKTKVKTIKQIIDNENETMHNLHQYLRSLDRESRETFYLNLKNAMTAINRELKQGQGKGFEWVGQLTVAANIIEDALDVAEAFTDGN